MFQSVASFSAGDKIPWIWISIWETSQLSMAKRNDHQIALSRYCGNVYAHCRVESSTVIQHDTTLCTLST